MQITVLTGASYCPETRAGGWGAWVKADVWGIPLTFGGVIPISLANNAEAEMMAMTYACSALHSKGLFDDMVVAVLQCDSMRVLQLILNNLREAQVRPGTRPIEQGNTTTSQVEQVALTALQDCFDPAIQVYVQHVKAFGRGNEDQKTSRKCDWIARHFMFQQRAKVLLGGRQ